MHENNFFLFVLQLSCLALGLYLLFALLMLAVTSISNALNGLDIIKPVPVFPYNTKITVIRGVASHNSITLYSL